MKKIVLLLLMVFLVGCGTSTQERVAEVQRWVDVTDNLVANAGFQVDVLQTQLDQAEAYLAANPALTPEQKSDITDIIGKIRLKLGVAIKSKQDYELYANQLRDQLKLLNENPNAGLGDEIQTVGKIASGISANLPPPFNAYVAIGGAVLTVVGGVFGGKVQKKKSDGVTAEIVRSVDTAMKTLSEADKKAFKVTLKNTQSPLIKKAVSAIKSI